MSLKWKDVTSWSQGDTKEERKNPRTWETKCGDIRITVTRHRHCDPTDWVLNVHTMQIDTHILESKYIDDAKREACTIVGKRLREMAKFADLIDPPK